jgi:predicted nucleotidyltransferase
MQDKKIMISSIYARLVLLFGTREILLIGGTSMILAFDDDRKLNDIDAIIDLNMLDKFTIKDEGRIKEFNFGSMFKDNKLIMLTDIESGIEIEVRAITCGALNKTLDLPPYTDMEPTAMGLLISDILRNANEVNINHVVIKIPDPVYQILMKYNLWRFRGKGEMKDQKDANDIRKLVNFYYGSVQKLLEEEDGEITYLSSRTTGFMERIKQICEAK